METDEKSPYEDWGFERFEGQVTLLKRPTIRVTKNKTIILNSAFIAKAEIEENGFQFVCLHFSKKRNAIAFEFLKERGKDPAALRLTLINDSNYSIAARSLFNFYEIDVAKWEGSYAPYLFCASTDQSEDGDFIWTIQLKDRQELKSPLRHKSMTLKGKKA